MQRSGTSLHLQPSFYKTERSDIYRIKKKLLCIAKGPAAIFARGTVVKISAIQKS